VVLLVWIAIASAEAPQKRVLVLYSTRPDAQIVVVGDRELVRTLGDGHPRGVDYYSEFIDQVRFSHPQDEAAFRDSLGLKYANHRFDLVIAVGDATLDFVEKHRDALFTDVPLVFFANRPPSRRAANTTGLIVELNLAATIDLALTLQPDIRRVFVITSDGLFEESARAQLGRFKPRLDIEFLSGLTTEDLASRLAALPDRSIVYYLVVGRDGARQNFHPLDYLDVVTAVANAPVYSWVDSTIGHGVVGGSLKVQEQQMRAIGALALRVLRGEQADSIPLSSPDLNVNQLDWRQLRRWGISEERVPAGTIVRFREQTSWERYGRYVLGAAAALLIQAALIASLLYQRTIRLRAERQVRGSQAALGASHERIRDLGARLLNAQESERARVARELHDDIGQQVAILQIDLELLSRRVHGGTARMVDVVLGRTAHIAKSTHDLSHRLHPAKLQLIGLVAAIEGLRREMSQLGVDITFTHGDVSAMVPEVTLCIFRVVQEALQNAVRHGRARAVTVHLDRLTSLTLTIVDDGVGFDVATAWGKGLGLISMRERVQAIGGTFQVRSAPNAGTQLMIMVPTSMKRESLAG
jgi:signal transduction histidine kinase